jgi:hypothetical protein
LSALPTQPAHGRPVACPLPPFTAVPVPFIDGAPWRVERSGLVGEVVLAPVLFESARENGCASVDEPELDEVLWAAAPVREGAPDAQALLE